MDIRTVFLKDYSSLRIGGEGKLVEVNTVEDLKEALIYTRDRGLRVHVLGGGTNSYFGEDLSAFLFIQPSFKGVEFKEEGEEVLVTAYANEIWDDIVQQSVKRGLWGIENLSYIPGSVGGAPVQNIGAYGMELKGPFVSLRAFNTETHEVKVFDKESCQFGYRDSIFKYAKGKYIIISVTLRLSKAPQPVLLYKPLDALQGRNDATPQVVRDAVIAIRTQKLPNYHEHPNAGSFFKNPVIDLGTSEYVKNLYPEVPLIQVVEGYKVPAAWLIEHVAHMKGVRVGDVGTWPNQPLVIVNYGNATADDIDELSKTVQKKINEKTGIVLEQEVNRIG